MAAAALNGARPLSSASAGGINKGLNARGGIGAAAHRAGAHRRQRGARHRRHHRGGLAYRGIIGISAASAALIASSRRSTLGIIIAKWRRGSLGSVMSSAASASAALAASARRSSRKWHAAARRWRPHRRRRRQLIGASSALSLIISSARPPRSSSAAAAAAASHRRSAQLIGSGARVMREMAAAHRPQLGALQLIIASALAASSALIAYNRRRSALSANKSSARESSRSALGSS